MTLDNLRALGVSDADIAGLLSFSPDINFGSIDLTSGVGPLAGVGTYDGETKTFTAPVSNKGNPTSQMYGNVFAVTPTSNVRLVNNATGEVVYSGTGYEAAQKATELAQGLTDEFGRKANWDIETDTSGRFTGGPDMFESVANEKPNKNVIGTIADIGLPILASALVPGGGFLGTILPSAAGSAASSVAQGRSLTDTLMRAAIAGGGAGLGEGIFGAGVPSGDAVAPTASLAADVLPNLPSLLDDIAATAAQNVASAGLGAVAPAVLPSIAGDIVATAIKSAAPSIAGSAIGSTAGSALSSAVIPETIVQAQTQPPPRYEVPPATPPISFPENILVDAQTQPTTQQDTPSATPPVSFPENILVTAPSATPVTPSPVPDVGPLDLAGVPISELLKDVAMPTVGNENLIDRITSNMGLSDYATLAGLLGSVVAGGVGSGSSPTTPYVSPFGTGTGTGFAARTQIDPNIIDYEKYGFGPEALFFSGGQTGPQQYRPLI